MGRILTAKALNNTITRRLTPGVQGLNSPLQPNAVTARDLNQQITASSIPALRAARQPEFAVRALNNRITRNSVAAIREARRPDFGTRSADIEARIANEINRSNRRALSPVTNAYAEKAYTSIAHEVPLPTSSSFSPASIAGLKLWLDASQITGLNDGDAVATWSDLSGNGYNATQATASKQPTYQTNEVNGKPAVQTDGVDDFIRSTFATSQPFTRFSVLSVSLTGGPHILGGVTANVALYCPGANLMQMYAGTFGPYTAVASSTWVLVVECYDGASSFIEVGGARTTGDPSTGSPGGVTIGADNSGNSNSSGKYAEVLHYNGRLSDGDISTLVTYLNTKYGL